MAVFCQTDVISRFSNYNADEYSVTDVESGDRIKFIAGGFVISNAFNYGQFDLGMEANEYYNKTFKNEKQ